jgi:hypothetical protein
VSNVATSPEIPPPPALSETSLVACVDCGASVFEWSTPHPDRCWECAEAADLEAAR